MRQHILTDLKKRYPTVEDAEDSLGITLESYLNDGDTSLTAKTPAALDISQSLLDKISHLTPLHLKALITESCQLLSKLPCIETDILEEVANTFLHMEWVTTHVNQLMTSWFEVASLEDSITVLNKCFDISAKKMGIQTNVLNFPELSLGSMKTLQDLGKSNTVYNLSKVINEPRPGGSGTLMPLGCPLEWCNTSLISLHAQILCRLVLFLSINCILSQRTCHFSFSLDCVAIIVIILITKK